MRLPSPVIVGRHRERTRLLAGAARPPALVLIEGEAGVGKTRLARELAEADLLTGHCCHLREPLPFGPVVEALRGLARKPGEALSPVTGVLRPLLPELAETLARQSSPPCVQLAHHWREAGDAGASRRYAERGAEAALAVGDDATAVGLLCRALSTSDVPPATRARMAVMLSKAAHSGLDNSETIAILREVLERDRMPRAVRGELRFYLASLLYNQAGSRAAAMAEVARAVPELRDRPALAARAMSTLALPIHVAGEPIADQLAWLEPARQAAARADDPVIRLAVLGNRAAALAQVGDAVAWRTARDLRDLSPASPGERYQLARAYHNLANATVLIGHYERARRHLEDVAPLVTETGSAYLADNAESIRLILDWATGRWDGLAERARRYADAHWHVPERGAEARMVAGRLALAAGDLAGAERMLTDALDAVAPDGTVPVLPVAIAGLARIWLATGRTARAGREVANAVAAIRRKGAWVWVAELAGVGVEALGRAGLVAQSRELVADFAAGLAGRDAPLATAALATAEASLSEVEGDPLAAARAFERARRSYERITRPFDAALALEGRGRCLLAAGRDGAAALHEAIAILERLGAPWPASRCRRTLRQHGVSARRGRRGYGTALSPREREVAALAARGQTNREIAAALFLSPRTVEEHVAKALRKLGLSTRAELPELIP